jgi:hypothetical protein
LASPTYCQPPYTPAGWRRNLPSSCLGAAPHSPLRRRLNREPVSCSLPQPPAFQQNQNKTSCRSSAALSPAFGNLQKFCDLEIRKNFARVSAGLTSDTVQWRLENCKNFARSV